MATVGNLFVNIGASSRGVEQATKQASAAVRSMKSDIDGALAQVPGLDRALGPLNSLLGFIKKISGDSKGMAAQLKVVAGIEKDLASATDKAAKAQHDLAAGQKYAAMVAKRSGMEEHLQKATAAVNKNVEAFRSYEARINRSTVRGAAYNSMLRKQEQNLRLLSATQRELSRRQSEASASDSKIGRMRKVLEQRGIAVRKDGGIDVEALKSKAASTAGAVEALQSKLVGAKNALKQFAALPAMSAMGMGLLAAGFVSAAGAAIGFAMSMAKVASDLYDQASALGITVSQYQKLRDTFAELGVAPGVAESAMQRLQAEMQNAVEGSEDAQDKFRRLGLDYNALAKMDASQAFDAVLTRLRALGSQGEKMKSLRDLFGRGGIGMAAAVNATAEELAHASHVADSLRLPDDLIRALDNTNDGAHAMWRAFENIGMLFAGELVPVVDLLTKSLREALTQDTQSLVTGFKVMALGVAMVVDAITSAIRQLTVVWNILQAIGGVIVSAIAGALALVIAPIGYIIKGVEWLLGASSGIGDALVSSADLLGNVALESIKGAGEDIAEGWNAAMSGGSKATRAVLDNMFNQYGDTKRAIESQPIAIAAKVDDESIKKIGEKMKALRDRVATFNMSDAEKELYELRGMGADDSALAFASALTKELEQLEKQKKAREDIKSIMDDLQVQADTALMSEEQKLQYKLRQLSASEAELAKARELSAAIKERTELMKAQEDSARTLEQLREKVRAAQIGEDAFAREQFKKGATGSQLEEFDRLTKQLQELEKQKEMQEEIKSIMEDLQTQADTALMTEEEKLQYKLKQLNASEEELARARELQAAIKERGELLKAQENSVQTLEDLREKVRKKQIGEEAFAREQFAAGATAAQLAEFDALQQQLKMLEDPTAVMDTADTAFGSFKMAGDLKQNEMLKEATAQTDLLQIIARNTQGMNGVLT